MIILVFLSALCVSLTHKFKTVSCFTGANRCHTWSWDLQVVTFSPWTASWFPQLLALFFGCWHNLAEWELSAFQHANALVSYCQWSVIICFETEAIFDVMFCWNEATSQPSKGYSILDLVFMNQMSVKEWLTHLPNISTPKEKQIHTDIHLTFACPSLL